MKKVNNWIGMVQQILYPPTCLLCGEPGQNDLDLCHGCQLDLCWIDHACTACGRPLPVADLLCGHCLRRPPPIDRTRVLWHYAPPISGLITALKFHRRLPCGKMMGELLAKQLRSAPRPDYLLPIPLHSHRYRERGFNQAVEIARPVSRELNIPMRPGLCKRIRPTPPQHELDAKHRRSNLRGAFKTTGKVEGLEIALIDDVMTTGATVREVADTLLKAGASKIEVWILARA